jgi:outer membrane protein TolC
MFFQNRTSRGPHFVLAVMTLGSICGCRSPMPHSKPPASLRTDARQTTRSETPSPPPSMVRQVSHQGAMPESEFKRLSLPESLPVTPAAPVPLTLEELEAQATANSPTLRRMQQEAAAEWAKAGYAYSLPDPTVSSMFFGDAMNFVPDKQIAEVQVMQMIPWLGRLQSESRKAQLEAMAAQSLYQAERQRVLGDLRAAWYRLYVLGKQLQTTDADQAQLESLLRTANSRVSTGDAQPGDVLMATL